ncbi:MAG: RNA polymerase sigma factor [Acidobacteria bacterium]|nr:RNA polymerase sigma factor [Acidobacteriota bacterium]
MDIFQDVHSEPCRSKDLGDPSEAALLERLKSGATSAFRDLVRQHQDRVLNTCYRFIPHREDAEDLAQEVFLAAYLALEGFRGDSRVSTWLHRIAVTRCLDFIRKAGRKKRSGYHLGIDRRSSGPAGDPPTPQPDPEAYTESRERLKVLMGVMGTLPDKQRVAFTLGKCDGLSHAEIAEVMGISASAVESLIHRARKNLEKRLRAYFEDQFRIRGNLQAGWGVPTLIFPSRGEEGLS